MCQLINYKVLDLPCQLLPYYTHEQEYAYSDKCSKCIVDHVMTAPLIIAIVPGASVSNKTQYSINFLINIVYEIVYYLCNLFCGCR